MSERKSVPDMPCPIQQWRWPFIHLTTDLLAGFYDEARTPIECRRSAIRKLRQLADVLDRFDGPVARHAIDSGLRTDDFWIEHLATAARHAEANA